MLILPGKPRQRAKLIIPAGVERPAAAFFCRVCKAQFAKDEATRYERHVVACAESHEDELRAESPRTQLPILHDPNMGDVELERWVRQHRKAIFEGRVRI